MVVKVLKSDHDINDWCVKTRQDHEDQALVELISKLPRL